MATAFAAWLAVAKLAAWLAAFSTDTLGSTAAVDSAAASDETAVDSAVAEEAGLTRASD